MIETGKLGLINERLLKARDGYLSLNSPSVCRCLVNFLNYGRAHADVPLMPRISWSDDGKTMFFEEKQFSIASFRLMIRTEIAGLDDMLVNIFGLDHCPEIDQSFLDRTHTGFASSVSFIEKGKEFYSKVAVDAIRHGGAERFGLAASLRECIMEQVACFRRVQKSVTSYLKILAFLIHVTAGQPSRGPEILGVRFQGSSGERPNIFNDGGRICMVTTYHKSQSVQDSHRLILRYIPYPIAQHIAIYLLYLRPLVNIQREIEGYSPLPATLFAVPSTKTPDSGCYRVLKTDDLTNQIACSSETFMGDRLTVSSYRHFAPAIVRKHLDAMHAKYLCLDGKSGEEEDDMDIFEEQAAHSAQTGRSIYAVDTGIGHLTDASTGKWRAASKAWHDFLFEEGFFRCPSSIGQIEKKKRKPADEISVFSCKKGVEPNVGSLNSTGNNRHSMSDEVLLSLYALTGGFTYKSSRQKESMDAVLSNDKIIVVTMETGGGKTLLFFLPLKLPNAAVTIYIAPLLGLTHDMAHRATAAKIANIVYTEEYVRNHEQTQGGFSGTSGTLIIVSQDQVGQEGFKKFVKRLVSKGLLDRIVIDEAHMTVTELDYRNSLADVSWIVNCNTQLLLLSGTLPGFILEGLGCVFGFDIADVRFLRFPTVRSNISYDIINPADNSPISSDLVCNFFLEKYNGIHDLCSDTDRAILYCQTARDAMKIAGRLGCHVYVGTERDEIVRQNTLRAWRDGSGAERPQLVVATKALGAGIDVPHVRLVVHWNAPSSLVDYIQESGRAGRSSIDGVSKTAWVYLLTKSNGLPNTFGDPYRNVFPFNQQLINLPSYKSMKTYIRSNGCFRTALHCFVDEDSSITCSSDPSYELCGNCITRFNDLLSMKPNERTNPALSGSRKDIILQNSVTSLETNRLMRIARQKTIAKLSSFRELVIAGQCCICLYLRDHMATTHQSPENCPNADKTTLGAIERIQNFLLDVYEPKLTCFGCHFTHPICCEWEECLEREPIALLVYFTAIGESHITLPATCETEEQIAKYLGVTRTIRGWKTTQLVMILEELLNGYWFLE